MKKAEKPFVVQDLAARIKDAKSLTVVDYQGLGVRELEELRAKIRGAGGVFLVVKNTLLRLAFQDSKLKVQSSNLEGPTAVVFSNDDEISPLQAIGKSIQKLDKPKLKFGIFDGSFINTEDLTRLSRLPGRDVLLGQLVGTLAGPTYAFIGTLKANSQSFVHILNERAKAQG